MTSSPPSLLRDRNFLSFWSRRPTANLARNWGGWLFQSSLSAYWARRHSSHRVEDRQRLAKEIAEGLRFVVRHPLLSRIATCTALANFSSILMFALLSILCSATWSWVQPDWRQPYPWERPVDCSAQ